MGQPIKIGLCLRFKNVPDWKTSWQTLYQEHLQYGAAADRLGFDGLVVPEHHCMESGYDPAPLIALTALAGVTKNCRLVTQPIIMPLHNPVLLAEEAAVVDVISGGRLLLGLGNGYTPEDFEALGVNMRERGARSDEVIEIIARALRGEAFDFSGRFYSVKGVKLRPNPVQTRMDMQLMIESAAAAKRAVRHAVDANLLSRAGVLKWGPVVAEETEKAGRSASNVGATVQVIGFIGGTREQAVRAALPYLRFQAREFLQNSLTNPEKKAAAEQMIAAVEKGMGPHTADEWLTSINGDIDAMASVGLRPDWINLTLWHSGMPLNQGIDALEAFAAQVLPHLRRGL